MKRYKPKNQTYATAFKVLLSVNHFLIIEFKEGDRWHKVALDHGVMHWFEEVDEFANLPKSAKEIDGRESGQPIENSSGVPERPEENGADNQENIKSRKMKTGIELIAKEIERQGKEEGYRPENDKNHPKGQIAIAAACYALAPFKLFSVRKGYSAPMEWPWSPESWKPTPNNRVKELTKAGVLIAAEIDRILELENQSTYKTGDRFRFIDGDFGEDYILSQVGPDTVCLISLRSGNRYHDPVEVEDVLKITHQEFKDISADDWMLFEPIGQ